MFTEIADKVASQAIAGTPLGHMVVPAKVGSAAPFLACEDAAMITGQHFGITGGATS